jgi:hypothetical protein
MMHPAGSVRPGPAALLALVLLVPAPSFAQDAFDLSVPKPGEMDAPKANVECATEKVSGSGPGFLSSRDESEDVAIAAWAEKAAAVGFPDADFDLAKDSNLSCAVQGLYSKCFADGIPCRPKGGADGDASGAQ